MPKITNVFVFVCILSLTLTAAGCASYPATFSDILGINYADLKKAQDKGVSAEIALSLNTAFEKTMALAKDNGLIIFRNSLRKGCIVVIGFPKQTNTTRVGIFFKPAGSGKTTVTISSLSSTALVKAKAMILDELSSPSTSSNNK